MTMMEHSYLRRHCEERSDEAIHLRSCEAEPWIASLALAMTMMEHSYLRRHCEKRSDEAIHLRSCGAEPWIASRSLSSDAHSRDPLARNNGSDRPHPGLRFAAADPPH
jgi:hypothetical protein